MILRVLLLSMCLLASCADDAISKANFVYKKTSDKEVVAEIAGQKITAKELYDGIEMDIFEAEEKVHEIKMNKLRALVLEKLMEADPKKKNMTNDEYLEKHIASTIKVSKADIDKFAKEKRIPKEQLNAQLKDRIRVFLETEKKKEAIEKWIANKTKKNPIVVFLNRPSRPVFDVKYDDSDPILGKKSAKVTIVEFSDFQCPYCAKATEILKKVKDKYGNKVKVIFKNYPLPFHNHAKAAAIAGLCAKEQGNDQFWKLHDKMFGDQTKLSITALKNSAKIIGLDTKKFNTCLDSKKYANAVEKDITDGQSASVKSTPTFFVNGKMINGAQPIEVFSELIDQELSL